MGRRERRVAARALASVKCCLPHTGACTALEPELAAFVDRWLDAGSSVAAAAHPGLWAHLRACAPCARTIRQIATLADAERQGRLEPPPLTPGE